MERETQFSQAELRLIRITSDGEPHTKDELRKCLRNPNASDGDLHQAIFVLRQKLKPHGQDIIAQSYGRGSKYRRIRHLRSPSLVGT